MKHYAVIGSPLTHSLSPRLHEAAMRELDIQGDFRAVEVLPQNLKHWMDIEGKNFDGIAVTAPHKETICSFLNGRSEAAQRIGAVNTLFWKNGILTGTNTDTIGALRSIQTIFNPQKKKVLLLGSGGVARAIVFALCMADSHITLWNRTAEKAKNLSKEFEISYERDKTKLHPEEFELIINATSVGLNEWKSLLPETFWLPHHVAFDTVYSPLETKFLSDASHRGAKIITGDVMLIHQAIEQVRIWHEKDIDPDVMAQAFLE
jgi:shikimate dehydrogenase